MSSFKLLTVLNLWFIEINKLPSTVTNLRNLRADEMISKSLAKLEQMKSLELFDVDASFAVKMSHLLKLQKLALSGRLARGKLPGWTCFLTSLKQVHLIASGIAQDSLLLLSSLPGLLHLGLNAAYREKEMTFAAGSFPALQTLTLLESSNLGQISRECLAELHELVLDRCTKLADSPKGMENLTRL
uniref:Disease resistance R13L4/SHOC-2-like LRR domain-containing protein n=1 Tax=Oryza barthii TaxID=65489 RepID=A0A0D3GX69_9ORYZ